MTTTKPTVEETEKNVMPTKEKYHTEFKMVHPSEFTKNELDELIKPFIVELVRIYAKKEDFKGKAVFNFNCTVGKTEDFNHE